MNTQSQALLLADVARYLENSEKSQWIMSAATELRRLDQLAMDQHTEIYGLRLQVRNLLYALKYHQEQTRPIQRTIDAIAKATGAA